MTLRSYLSLLSAVLTCVVLASCTSTRPAEVQLQPKGPSKYEQFILKTPSYPKTMAVFEDTELLAKMSKKSPIFISLEQQRGRLYIDGEVAMDWPVSTGVDGHVTPTGRFKIVEKEKEHASNRYGHLYDAEGKCVNYNADIFVDEMPEGGRFDGSPMPNWMRLTGDGVGMHTGKVQAGRRLSHGCIRTPNAVAVKLFDLTSEGTPVTICEKLEPQYDVMERIEDRAHQDTVDDLLREAAKIRAAREKARAAR